MKPTPVARRILCWAAGLGALWPAPPAGAQPTAQVPAAAETTPLSSPGATAADAAVWVDSTDPAASLVVGAGGGDGLDVYDLAGNRVQHSDRPVAARSVDLRSGFPLGGRVVDLVAAAGRGIAFFAVEPARRRLVDVSARVWPAPYAGGGICLYHSDSSERFYAFTADPDGFVTQWELLDRDGLVDVRRVRGFQVGSAAQGCVADDDLGRLYVSERRVGVWEYGAEPHTSAAARNLVDRVGDEGHLSADVGGLAIARQPGRRGYLLVSSQGDSSFAVYRRQAHPFLGRVEVGGSSAADGCSGTVGIEAAAVALGSAFPFGLFVCGDADNAVPGPAGAPNFKYVRLEGVLAAAEAQPESRAA
jgi:3-phytase